LLASSPLPYPLLGKIHRIHLSVPSSDLGWEPIPGLDRRDLEEEITEKTRAAVDRTGLEISEPPEAYLLITVTHAWNGSKRDSVALLVTVSLEILAQPTDASYREAVPGRPTLPIWESQHLVLAPPSGARKSILRELDSALDYLAERRREAQEQ